MDELATIRIKEFRDTGAILMEWDHQVDSFDVNQAFREIEALLHEAEEPRFVVVDLLANPNLPMAATVQGAAFGPYRNPHLREWLIIGGNTLARTVARMLAASTRRMNVNWFDTEDEVAEYLQRAREQEVQQPPAGS